MRPRIRIRVDAGIDRKLRAMAGALTPRALTKIMTDRLEPLADGMRSKVHVKSGELRGSIHVGQQLSPAQAAAHVPQAEVEVFVGAGPLVQAIQEEFGNVRQSPHSFVRPTFEEMGQAAARGIAQDGVKLIERAAKRG